MSPRSPSTGDGLVREFAPLLKNGFIVLRSILDILIERMDEAEANRECDIRKDIYESIIENLEAEIEKVGAAGEDPRIADTKVEVFEAVISILLREIEEMESPDRADRKRPRKVDIS